MASGSAVEKLVRDLLEALNRLPEGREREETLFYVLATLASEAQVPRFFVITLLELVKSLLIQGIVARGTEELGGKLDYVA